MAKTPLIYENIFGKSVERGISATKRPVHVGISLWDEKYTKRIEDTTVFTGTKIVIAVTLHEKADGYICKNPDYYPESTDRQPVDVYLRVAGGAWTKIFTVTTGVTSDLGKPTGCGADKFYTLMSVGKHDFYAEYKGNAYLEGCGSKVVSSLAKPCSAC